MKQTAEAASAFLETAQKVMTDPNTAVEVANVECASLESEFVLVLGRAAAASNLVKQNKAAASAASTLRTLQAAESAPKSCRIALTAAGRKHLEIQDQLSSASSRLQSLVEATEIRKRDLVESQQALKSATEAVKVAEHNKTAKSDSQKRILATKDPQIQVSASMEAMASRFLC